MKQEKRVSWSRVLGLGAFALYRMQTGALKMERERRELATVPLERATEARAKRKGEKKK